MTAILKNGDRIKLTQEMVESIAANILREGGAKSFQCFFENNVCVGMIQTNEIACIVPHNDIFP